MDTCTIKASPLRHSFFSRNSSVILVVFRFTFFVLSRFVFSYSSEDCTGCTEEHDLCLNMISDLLDYFALLLPREARACLLQSYPAPAAAAAGWMPSAWQPWRKRAAPLAALPQPAAVCHVLTRPARLRPSESVTTPRSESPSWRCRTAGDWS